MNVLFIITSLAAVVSVSCAEKVRVQLSHVDWSTGRHRRSLTDDYHCSPALVIKFVLRSKNIVLKLVKNDMHHEMEPAIFVSEHGKIRKVADPPTPKFCLYQDVARHSSMRVECKHGFCEVDGKFRDGSKMYQLSSNHEASEADIEAIEYNTPDVMFDHVLSAPQEEQVKRRARRRRRRSIPTGTDIVEFLAVADVSVYDHHLALNGTDSGAEASMWAYYASLVNEIDLHYLSVPTVKSSLNIRLYFAGVVIAKTASAAPWSSQNTVVFDGELHLNIEKALQELGEWRYSKRFDLDQHDFAMGYTLLPLERVDATTGNSNGGVAGAAFVSVVCTDGNYNAGITRDQWRSALISAHELGHALGSRHDGSNNDCSSSNHNVMKSSSLRTTSSTTIAGNQWKFSSCSVDYFDSYINGLSTNCMLSHGFTATEYDTQRALLYAGEQYSLDAQCQLEIGSSAQACITRAGESDCHDGFRCRPSASDSCSENIYPRTGTPCGNAAANKWCFNGICQAKPSTATTTAPTTTTASTTTTAPTTTTASTTTTAPTTTTASTTTTAPTTTTASTTTTAPTTTTTTTSATTAAPTTTTTSTTTTAPTTTTTSSSGTNTCTNSEYCCTYGYGGWHCTLNVDCIEC